MSDDDDNYEGRGDPSVFSQEFKKAGWKVDDQGHVVEEVRSAGRPRPELVLLPEEEFRPISGSSRFEVSNHGRIRCRENGDWCLVGSSTGKSWIDMDDGAKKFLPVKRLVAQAFIVPTPLPGAWIRLRDGNPKNCSLENLVLMDIYGPSKNAVVPPAQPGAESFREEPAKTSYFLSDDNLVVKIGPKFFLIKNYEEVRMERRAGPMGLARWIITRDTESKTESKT